jgi:predicted ATPase
VIRSLDLKAFKRFENIQIEFGRLTVLTGLNGSGKSTIVQSLLLAHQASLSEESSVVPLVAPPGLDLGQASDVLNVNASDATIEVKVLNDDGSEYQWIFDTGDAGADDGAFLQILEKPNTPHESLGSSRGSFTFLSAERLGPRTSHPTAPSQPDETEVGEDGRFVAHALAVGLRREVEVGRRHTDAGNISTLGAQVEAWLSSLVGPTQLDSSIIPHTGIAILRIRTPGKMSEWMLPTNTGFGVSYCLPVIVAGLIAPNGGLLIVDSPEAHLHPAAQSAMGVFLAIVAASGVQVVMETHSDHVLNGVRRAVSSESILHHSMIRVLFFDASATPQQLTVTEHGSLSDWPAGFFDQLETDLGEITRSRTR